MKPLGLRRVHGTRSYEVVWAHATRSVTLIWSGEAPPRHKFSRYAMLGDPVARLLERWEEPDAAQ